MINLNFLPSILITGANKEERIRKAAEFLDQDTEVDNPDFLRLKKTEEKESIGIEEARDIQKFLLLKPYAQKNKAVLIEEAQYLTTEAQNALLKTLEEPSSNSLIILTAPDENMLLATIVSRCQLINLTLKPQIILSLKEEKEIRETLEDLLKISVPLRLGFTENLSAYKNKQEAIAWLDKLTVVLRNLMLDGFQNPNIKYLNFLKLVNKTKKYLQSNVNVKLALDNLLISL